MQSLYWVITLRCNDLCAHCYNDSGPAGEAIELTELLRVVPRLPDRLEKIILSGGEPTIEMEKLVGVISALRARYGSSAAVYLQTNGDLLDDKRLERILDAGVDRIDVVSLDRFHKNRGRHAESLRERFERFGLHDANGPEAGRRAGAGGKAYAFWGATEDLWLKGNWARGRALDNGLAKLDPSHNFCALWSGALGFLDEGSERQEIHIQLYRVYPCCPTTYYSLGDAREESVERILARYQKEETFLALNRGEPAEMGIGSGITRAYAELRIRELGDVCLWCDEYFRSHYEGARGEARRERLPSAVVRSSHATHSSSAGAGGGEALPPRPSLS